MLNQNITLVTQRIITCEIIFAVSQKDKLLGSRF